MKIHTILGACALLACSSTHGSGNECDANFVASNPASGLWALDVGAQNGGATASGAWVQLKTETSLRRDTVQGFAYVGRHTSVLADRQGVVSVKFIQFAKNGSDHIQQVSLRRNVLGSTCGARSFLQIFAFPLDFLAGQQVGVADYIAYHATDSRSNSTLQRFHLNYRSEAEDCVGTDSSKGNRRTAYLAEYDGPTISTRDEAIVALQNILSPSVAIAEPSNGAERANSGFRLPAVLAQEAKAFRQFATFESQTHTYNLTGQVCVSFSDISATRVPGAAYRIEVVDLDAPKNSGIGRRQRWVVNWK